MTKTKTGKGATPLNSKSFGVRSNYGHFAFTLAETLVTLSIIGTVAALTLPGLAQNHNEHVWSTSQDLFAKKLEVAMQTMNADGRLSGYSSTADFVNELKKNIQVSEVCTNEVTQCFTRNVIWNENEAPVRITNDVVNYVSKNDYDWGETVGVRFNNGVMALMSYNKNCYVDSFDNSQSASEKCLGIIYDVTADKKPNKNGQDIMANANIASLGGITECVYTLTDGTCFTKILTPKTEYSAMSNADCTEKKDNNEIDIADCGLGDNYYAGAIYACGGSRENLPSQRQLALLATELYGKNVGLNSYVTGELNTTAARPFLTKSPGGTGDTPWFQIYGNSGGSSCFRDFSSLSTSWGTGGIASENKLAVCVKH